MKINDLKEIMIEIAEKILEEGIEKPSLFILIYKATLETTTEFISQIAIMDHKSMNDNILGIKKRITESLGFENLIMVGSLSYARFIKRSENESYLNDLPLNIFSNSRDSLAIVIESKLLSMVFNIPIEDKILIKDEISEQRLDSNFLLSGILRNPDETLN